MEKIIITIFTDPMMGLSYESEPVFDKLRMTYGSSLEIRHVMAGLVRDVSDFMTAEELSYEPKEGIRRYCARLAQIYKSEEYIGGLPINMEGFHLFDADHRSSYPLNIAYEAAKLTDPDKACDFLRRLRRATIVEIRQTTRFDVIMDVVRDTGLDENAFQDSYNSGSAEAAFAEDLKLTASLGIHSLPAYLIQYKEKALLIKTLAGYEMLADAIDRLRSS